MDHHSLFSIAGSNFPAQLWETVSELYDIERPFGSSALARSARYCADGLRAAGAEQVELLTFPADGRTAYWDTRMPSAWEPIIGRLEVTSPRDAFQNPLLADISRNRFHLMTGSASTPAGGMPVEIVSESMMLDGHSIQGCLVLPEPHHTPRQLFQAVRNFGGAGIISDYVLDPFATPDGLYRHEDSAEPAGLGLIGFCVSPRIGQTLRRVLADSGKIAARAEVRTHESPGLHYAATGVLPGRSNPSEEIWVVAHLGEPFGTGSCAGAAVALVVASALERFLKAGELPPLKRSIRFLFAAKPHGIAAALKTLSERGRRPMAVLLTDSHPIRPTRSRKLPEIRLSSIANPLFSDTPFRMLVDFCLNPSSAAWIMVNGREDRRLNLKSAPRPGNFDDDALLADPLTGAPCFQVAADEGAYRHNSENTLEKVWPELLNMMVPLHGAYAVALAALGPDDAPRLVTAVENETAEFIRISLSGDSVAGLTPAERGEAADAALRLVQRRFDNLAQWVGGIDPAACSRVRELARSLAGDSMQVPELGASQERTDRMARTVIFARRAPALPADQLFVRRPEDRRDLYPDLHRILALTDGARSLHEIIRELEALSDKPVDRARVLGDCLFLGEHGYLDARVTEFVTKADLVAGLRQAGVREGDLVLAHAALSAFGHVLGGAQTCVDALLESVGPRGTVLMPAFTRSYVCFEGVVQRRLSKAPYHPRQANLATGAVSEAFLRRADFRRSNHPSHSVAGIGPLTSQCLDAQRLTDPPTGETSPFARLPALGGKIVYLGAPLGSSTFLHYLETRLNLAYLTDALCFVRDARGDLDIVYVARHLAGHRDFYGPAWRDSKIFRALDAAGLPIRKSQVGLGWIHLIEAKDFEEKGLAAMRADPTILLCDKPDCLFCVRAGKKVFDSHAIEDRGAAPERLTHEAD